MTGWGKEQMVQNGGCPGCVAEGWERVQSGETGEAEEGQVAKDLEMPARPGVRPSLCWKPGPWSADQTRAVSTSNGAELGTLPPLSP